MYILEEILLGESRNCETIVTFLEVFAGFVLPGKETAPERAISYRGDTKLAAGLKKADLGVLDVSTERAVFHLDGSDRVDFIGTAEGGRGNLTKTKVLDFSFPAESQIFTYMTIICAPEDFTAADVYLKKNIVLTSSVRPWLPLSSRLVSSNLPDGSKTNR